MAAADPTYLPNVLNETVAVDASDKDRLRIRYDKPRPDGSLRHFDYALFAPRVPITWPPGRPYIVQKGVPPSSAKGGPFPTIDAAVRAAGADPLGYVVVRAGTYAEQPGGTMPVLADPTDFGRVILTRNPVYGANAYFVSMAGGSWLDGFVIRGCKGDFTREQIDAAGRAPWQGHGWYSVGQAQCTNCIIYNCVGCGSRRGHNWGEPGAYQDGVIAFENAGQCGIDSSEPGDTCRRGLSFNNDGQGIMIGGRADGPSAHLSLCANLVFGNAGHGIWGSCHHSELKQNTVIGNAHGLEANVSGAGIDLIDPPGEDPATVWVHNNVVARNRDYQFAPGGHFRDDANRVWPGPARPGALCPIVADWPALDADPARAWMGGDFRTDQTGMGCHAAL